MLRIFESTVARWCGRHNMGADKFLVLSGDSLHLTAEDILAKSGGTRFRFFSVDGSHVEAAAFADMTTAAVMTSYVCPRLPSYVCPHMCA